MQASTWLTLREVARPASMLLIWTATLLAIWNSGCRACNDRLKNGPALRAFPCRGHHFSAYMMA